MDLTAGFIFPKYNFSTSSKSFNSDPIKLDNNDVLIIEGLHCLNEIVSENIEKKYK